MIRLEKIVAEMKKNRAYLLFALVEAQTKLAKIESDKKEMY